MTSIYVYTAELYPTKYRHSLFAFSSMMGRIGSILAPLTPALVSICYERMFGIRRTRWIMERCCNLKELCTNQFYAVSFLHFEVTQCKKNKSIKALKNVALFCPLKRTPFFFTWYKTTNVDLAFLWKSFMRVCHPSLLFKADRQCIMNVSSTSDLLAYHVKSIVMHQVQNYKRGFSVPVVELYRSLPSFTIVLSGQAVYEWDTLEFFAYHVKSTVN